MDSKLPGTRDPLSIYNKLTAPTHYYGDLVRKLFLAGAIIMLAGLPFFADLISTPLMVSIFAIVLIGTAAGFMNPKQLWVAILNALIAVGALVVFEMSAVSDFKLYSIGHPLFWIDQVLALLFLVALYYEVKTLRGMLLKQGD